MEILECGHPESPHFSFTRGYGKDANGNRHCYDCCAESDRQSMIDTGRGVLYLTIRDEISPAGGNYGDKIGTLTNWPGSLTFQTGRIRKGYHNIAGVRYDTWFRGPDGHKWHAVQYGDNTQIAHCKRVKGGK